MNCVQFNILIKTLNILPNVEILREILKAQFKQHAHRISMEIALNLSLFNTRIVYLCGYCKIFFSLKVLFNDN
jgi:hypothetical protein